MDNRQHWLSSKTNSSFKVDVGGGWRLSPRPPQLRLTWRDPNRTERAAIGRRPSPETRSRTSTRRHDTPRPEAIDGNDVVDRAIAWRNADPSRADRPDQWWPTTGRDYSSTGSPKCWTKVVKKKKLIFNTFHSKVSRGQTVFTFLL